MPRPSANRSAFWFGSAQCSRRSISSWSSLKSSRGMDRQAGRRDAVARRFLEVSLHSRQQLVSCQHRPGRRPLHLRAAPCFRSSHPCPDHRRPLRGVPDRALNCPELSALRLRVARGLQIVRQGRGFRPLPGVRLLGGSADDQAISQPGRSARHQQRRGRADRAAGSAPGHRRGRCLAVLLSLGVAVAVPAAISDGFFGPSGQAGGNARSEARGRDLLIAAFQRRRSDEMFQRSSLAIDAGGTRRRDHGGIYKQGGVRLAACRPRADPFRVPLSPISQPT